MSTRRTFVRPVCPSIISENGMGTKCPACIETIAGKGCFVRANHSPFKKEVRRKLLAETLDGAVIQAHHLQIDKADFLRVAEERFDALEHKRHAANS